MATQSNQDAMAGGRSFAAPGLYLIEAQAAVLWHFAGQVAGGRPAVRRLSYHLLGTEDLADHREAGALLHALQSGRWEAARRHQALAGANNLLLALLLRVEQEGGQAADYWVALRSPFELMESASVVAFGRVSAAPPATLAPLPPR